MGSKGNGGNTSSSDMVIYSNSDKVSGTKMCSDLIIGNGGGSTFFRCNNWDPLVSLNQSVDFGNPTMVNPHSSILLDNQAIGCSSSSHVVHFPPDFGMVPKIPNIGCQIFPEMVNSFSPIPESSRWIGAHKDSQHKCQSSEGRKRKRKVPIGASPKSGEAHDMDASDFCTREDDDDKKQNNNGKETYIHVRAKRGQATNSHSLAERVRRERISERMRLLQELVPGCNKIAGKAMMLDEIINYVQSLQQQVEFLSMKLATVNPELNLDIDRILSKELLHLGCSNTTALGITSGSSSLHPPFNGYPFNDTPGTATPFLPLPPQLQHIWNNELQGINQMEFDCNPSACNFASNGTLKTEL